MDTTTIESIASSRKKTKESVRAESLLPEGLREKSATLIQLLKDYYAFMNSEFEPSYELNSINISRDLDEADNVFLDKLQKEIAYAVPRAVVADRLRLYKNLIRYYRLKGSAESIQLFFRIIFNDPVEVYYPRDEMLIPSDGKWDPTFERAVYTEDPIVFVTGNGTGAYGKAIIADGVIAQIAVDDPGSGYDPDPENPPEVTITDASGGTGTGATAIGGVGIGQIKLTFPSGWSGGLGYSADDVTVTITDASGGSGADATAEAVLDEYGTITHIYVSNRGTGYVNPSIAITGTLSSGGSAADLPDISTDYGQLLFVKILTGGKNYISPTATISGNAVLGTPVTSDGAVSEIITSEYGVNYTTATAQVLSTNTSPAVIKPRLRDPDNVLQPGNSIVAYDILYCGAGYPFPGQFLGNSYGRYANRKGFLSDLMHLQDSYFWQKYSYVIRTGNSIETWKDIFAKLVHPAGFIYFGEILLLIELLNLKSKMPYEQPGVAGDAERTIKILLEALITSALAETNYTSTLQIESTGLDLDEQVRASDDTPFALAYGNLTVAQADGNQGAVDPLYPYGNRSVSTAINSGTTPYVVNGVTYTVELV